MSLAIAIVVAVITVVVITTDYYCTFTTNSMDDIDIGWFHCDLDHLCFTSWRCIGHRKRLRRETSVRLSDAIQFDPFEIHFIDGGRTDKATTSPERTVVKYLPTLVVVSIVSGRAYIERFYSSDQTMFENAAKTTGTGKETTELRSHTIRVTVKEGILPESFSSQGVPYHPNRTGTGWEGRI